MKIVIEIDTESMTARDERVLAALSGTATSPLAFAASAAADQSDTSGGATSATETTSEPSKRGGRGAKKTEAAVSTPASGTSPGDVFSNPTAAAQTAASPAGALTGDVFSQQVKAANVAAAEASQSGEAVSKDKVSARVSELLPTLGAKGLKELLGKFTKADGAPVTVLRELEEKDFGAFLEELSVY